MPTRVLNSAPSPMHSNMETWMLLCGTVCFCSHPTSVPRPWSECVHASVHIFMPTWLLNSVPSPIHSDVETWVSVCGTVYVAVISFLFPHLGQNVYMHQDIYLCQPEFWILLHSLSIVTWKHRCHCVTLCVLQSSHFCSQTLVRMCTYISICTFLCLIPHVWFTPLPYLYGKMGSSV